jgi:hypothetical protein
MKLTRRSIEVVLFLVCVAAGYSLGHRIIVVRAIARAKAEIRRAQAQQKPDPRDSPFYIPPKQQEPWLFGQPPAQDLFDLPYTTVPPEPGSPAWYDSLPPIPPCVNPWDIWRQPQCQRVSNYI